MINEPWEGGCGNLRTWELRWWEMIFASTWDPLSSRATEFSLKKQNWYQARVLLPRCRRPLV